MPRTNKKYILTVTLNPAIDQTLHIKKLPKSKKFLVENMLLSAGGKGVNVSRGLKHLRMKTLAVGLLGGPNGDFIKERLDEEGIDHDFTAIKGNTRISLTMIEKRTGRTTRRLKKGPRVSRKETNDLKKVFSLRLKNASWIVLGGRNAFGAGHDLYAQLIKLAHTRGVPTLLDTHGQSFRFGLKAKPFCVTPNLMEAQAILRRKLNSDAKLKGALKSFSKKGIENSFISLGSRGAVGFDGQKFWLAQAPVIKSLNQVGCGDAFNAGLILGFQKKKNMKEALRLAVAVATANAMSLTPGEFTMSQAQKLLKRVHLKAI